MGTSNFYNKNAKDIYAVLMNEYENDEHVYPDEWECDDLIDNTTYELESKGYTKVGKWDNDRNFSGLILAEKTIYKSFGDVEVGFTIKAFLRSGYYDGANLDWELYNYEGYEDDYGSIVDDMQSYMEESYDMNRGMVMIQTKHAENWIDTEIQKEINILENFYQEICQHKLGVAARFSNGETIYTKVN